jgi:16S rRNA (cytidine1402-2'-O)-methyltransferase
MAGRLLIVATPIGNLEDLSPRVVESLRAADRILAEDTRRTRQLLTHLGITQKRLVRLDAEMEARGVASFVSALAAGETIALVSDAGTPNVSDPGATLVRAAAAQAIVVTPIPGPSAVTAALAASGFGGARFRFVGFLPRGGSERQQALRVVAETPEPTVLFEAPTRLMSTLSDLARVMPAREAVVARELSKLHEELVRGTLAELAAAERDWRGEITVVLGEAPQESVKLGADELDARIARALAEGLRSKDAAKALSLESGWSARDIYARISAKKKEQP